MSKDFFTFVKDDRSRLVQLSFLMLFVELMLIRWTGSNIIALSFYSNFVLLASFLGIGIGFIRSTSSFQLFRFSPIFLALLIYFCYRYHYEYQVQLNEATDDLNLYQTFFKANVIPIWVSLPIIFVSVIVVMMTIADGVARHFRQFSALQAYRLEILGSLLGVIIFSILSFSSASPLWWGMVINLLFISLLSQTWRLRSVLTLLQVISLIIIFCVVGREVIVSNNIWSPYYKISVLPYTHHRYAISVNGIPQQFIESVEQKKVYKPFYFYPYQHLSSSTVLNNVLIIGAGTGGDVAVALAMGAKHVDAVEIDPVLYHLGKKLNSDHPYNDARVRVFIEDGRTFLQQHHDLYDMIVFALPDSLMIISRQSSLRLENYLFTLEGIEQVKSHLKPDGLFTMYNYYRLDWIVDRLANTLATVFNHAPCMDTGGEQAHWLTVLSISPTQSALQCSTRWKITESLYATPTTDDHPFLYLEENRLPFFYIITLLFILIASHYAFKMSGVAYHSILKHADLFFMGAAFLLLETKSIINFALLFGSTWFVNALVFIGILATVYVGIEVQHRLHLSRSVWLYGLLLVSLALAWLIPIHLLLSLSFTMRFVAAVILTFSPILLANLIFTHHFQERANSTECFGANLIGAVVGGLLEYLSIIVGYRHLLIIVAILYALALLSMLVRQREYVFSQRLK
jgi:protein-L-isoaspartate O-methyltransferase